MGKKATRRKMQKEIRTTAAAPATTAPSSKAYEFKPDYSYVIKDLRRIGTLAGTFVLVLLVLSFFLR